MRKNFIKKLAVVGAAVMMMSTTAMGAYTTWSIKTTKTSYTSSSTAALKTANSDSSKDKYATIVRTDTNSTVLAGTKLLAYTQARTHSAYMSNVVTITYPSTSATATYSSYTTAYLNDYYWTYTKLDATASYTSWTIPGKTQS